MRIIGQITSSIQNCLNLNITGDNAIYLGETNINHMKSSHPNDYAKYKDEIQNILASPDYVAVNPKDNSIEYVKEFQIDDEFVKVAVRISNGNKYYARSIYVLNSQRVKSFISKGTLKKP